MASSPPARAAGGLVRGRDVRAQPRGAHGREPGPGRLRAGLRRGAAGALPQGRGVPPHRRPGCVDRRALGRLVVGAGAGARSRAGTWRPALGSHDRQRRVLARHRRTEPALPSTGEGLRGRLRDRARGTRPRRLGRAVRDRDPRPGDRDAGESRRAGGGAALSERFLITGMLGCVGAWVARTLVREGAGVVGFDLGTDLRRLELIMEPNEVARVTLVRGDVTDLASLEQALDEHEITNVIHLAAMLIPLVKADPPRGAHVNVVGTVNVFEAVKRRRDRIRGVAYASSAAVYDRADGAWVAEDARGAPVTHYGVHKQANEGTARIYWLDDELPSVGLRPYVVYGPGRDQGVTAAPTLAMEAAARGDGYHIPLD